MAGAAVSQVFGIWERASRVFWAHLPGLIGLNVLIVLTALPVVTAGVGLLAGYWWVARCARDEIGSGLGAYWLAARRFFWRGVAVSGIGALFAALMYTNLIFWPQVLPPLLAGIIVVTWLYAAFVGLVALPFFLEGYVVEEQPLGKSLLAAGLSIALHPLPLHLTGALGVALVWVATRFHTFGWLVLVAALLVLGAALVEGREPRLERT
jgi:hypothetical protein